MLQELNEFFREHFNIIVYLITLIIAVRHYRKYFDTELKFFPVIIAYTFFNELLGYFIRYSENFAFFNEFTSANDLIYNIYALIFFGYFYFVYVKLISKVKHKRLVKAFSILVFVVFFINAIFMNPLRISLYYALSLASFVLAFTIVLYFKSRNEWRWKLERHNLVTWVSIGLFFFYLIFPFFYLIGYLKPQVWYEYNLQIILRINIVIMNILFCIGFIVSHRRAFR